MKLTSIFISLLASLSLIACTSTTHIDTTDPDAKIFVNGEYLGTGHAHYSDRKISFASNEVKIRKEGCRPQYHTFSRNEGLHLGAIIGGYLFTVPYLWVADYKPYREYDYQCEAEASLKDE